MDEKTQVEIEVLPKLTQDLILIPIEKPIDD